MSDESIKITRRKITDYEKDPANKNKGRERGKQMVATSWRKLGAGRSMLADKNGVLIAGNHSQDGAIEAGIEDVIEIETDGKTAVVVRRTDLDLTDETDKRAQELAISDNRTSEVNLDFDIEALFQDKHILADWFRDDELNSLINETEVQRAVNDKLAIEVSTDRGLGNKKKQIKPVLYVDEVALFERAIRATGLINRGQAMLEICKAYLEHHSEGRAEKVSENRVEGTF